MDSWIHETHELSASPYFFISKARKNVGVSFRQLSKISSLTTSRRLQTDHSKRWVILVIGTVLALIGIGAAILPTEVSRGSIEDPGGVALEMSFWLACLASALMSFRIMEAFFRRGDARILAPLPISTKVLFFHRLYSGLKESLLVAVGGSLLFLPVLWRGDAGIYAACAGVWFAGMLTTLCVGFGVQMYTGKADLEGEAGFDMHGPTGFGMAPGIALAVSVFMILLEKLVAEEFLKAGFNGGARLGILLSAGGSLLCLFLAYRWFTQHFHGMYARFLQADLFVLDVGYEYFKEGPTPPSIQERRLPKSWLPLVRKERLQYRRRYTLSRVMIWGVALGLGGLLAVQDQPSLPDPFLLISPFAVVLLFANPWSRLSGKDLDRGLSHTLPISKADLLGAREHVALSESGYLGLLISLGILLGLGLGLSDWVEAVIMGSLAWGLLLSAHPLMSHAARFNPIRTFFIGALLLTLQSAFAAWHIWLTLPVAIVTFVVGRVLLSRFDSLPTASPQV